MIDINFPEKPQKNLFLPKSYKLAMILLYHKEIITTIK